MKIRMFSMAAAAATSILFSSATLAAASDAPASEASIRELMEITQASKLIDGVSVQLDGMMQNTIARSLAGKNISPEQQQVIDEMRTRLVGILTQNLRWDQMEPMMIEIYKQTFSQAEIDGMVAFYRTDIGKALIAKMPLVMENSMKAVQERTASITPQIQQLTRETIEKLQALEQDSPARTD